MSGAFHDWIVIIDMAEQRQDAQHVSIINRVKYGLVFPLRPDDIGAWQTRIFNVTNMLIK